MRCRLATLSTADHVSFVVEPVITYRSWVDVRLDVLLVLRPS